MVKVIMGLKGSGKTKQLIELVHNAIEDERGDVVCIEKGAKLTYDIPHKVRLIEASQYQFDGYVFIKGFICGLHSANYDITHIFIDSLLKITGRDFDGDLEEFLNWCEEFGKREHVKFTITVSADASQATEGMKKYF